MCAAVVVGTVSLAVSPAWSQTSVIEQSNVSSQTSGIQQNSANVNGEGSSVTVSGRSISVETTATGGGRVVGDGQPASEDRPIGPVTAIHSDGAFALDCKNRAGAQADHRN